MLIRNAEPQSHFIGLSLALVHPRETESSGQEADIVRSIDVCETERHVVELALFGKSGDGFFGLEFRSRHLKPRFQRSVLFAPTARDGTGHGRLVYHPGAELHQHWGW